MAIQRKKTKKEKQRRQEKRRQRKRKLEEVVFDVEYDETFSFIAGYTEGGAPYGITYDEMLQIKKLEELDFGYQFFQLEFKDDWEDSFFYVDDDDFENEWFDPIDHELALQLLVEQQNKPIKWENSFLYDPSFNWDNYFGLQGKEQTREKLIHHLNLFDLLKDLRQKKKRW